MFLPANTTKGHLRNISSVRRVPSHDLIRITINKIKGRLFIHENKEINSLSDFETTERTPFVIADTMDLPCRDLRKGKNFTCKK